MGHRADGSCSERKGIKMAARNKPTVYLSDKTLELIRVNKPEGASVSRFINECIARQLGKKKKKGEA